MNKTNTEIDEKLRDELGIFYKDLAEIINVINDEDIGNFISASAIKIKKNLMSKFEKNHKEVERLSSDLRKELSESEKHDFAEKDMPDLLEKIAQSFAVYEITTTTSKITAFKKEHPFDFMKPKMQRMLENAIAKKFQRMILDSYKK